MAQRDSYQRKAYAMRRMSLAVMRLSQAKSQAEKKKAAGRVKMWGRISGIRQFKLGNGGGSTRK
jgi:protein subunit release factor B